MGLTLLFATLTVHCSWQENKRKDMSLHAADMIKVEVQYVQYVAILASIPIPWPAFLVPPASVASVVATITGLGLMMDCWLPHYFPNKLPLALQRTLADFVGALAIVVACVVLLHLLHVCNKALTLCKLRQVAASAEEPVLKSHFWSKLRVAVIVTVFFKYPMLVKAALGFFACLPIDVADQQPYPEYAISYHTARYWGSNIQQECFAGWHKPWALYFGVPAVLLLCIGVPMGLFLFPWRSKTKPSDVVSMEQFGFLFHDYIESKPWWEAIVAAQTTLLAAVSVFHFTIQAYYALLVMQLILLSSVVAQVIAQPYAQPRLHQLHLASTSCLSLIVRLCLTLFSASVEADSTTLYLVHIVFGALMLLLVGVFDVWGLVMILREIFAALGGPAATELSIGITASNGSIGTPTLRISRDRTHTIASVDLLQKLRNHRGQPPQIGGRGHSQG